MHICIILPVFTIGPGPESFAIPLYFFIVFETTASSHFPYITKSLLSLILTPKLAYLFPISINTLLADASFIFSNDYGPFSRKSSRLNWLILFLHAENAGILYLICEPDSKLSSGMLTNSIITFIVATSAKGKVKIR